MNRTERLKQFQAQYRSLANNRADFDARRAADVTFSEQIEWLYTHFIGTFSRYCGNCWHDAFIHILTLKPMETKHTQFSLLAGVLLHDPLNRDVDFMLTPMRLACKGDDLALRHLAHNPDAVEYFEKPLPANLKQMIAEYLIREKGEQPKEGQTTPKKIVKPAAKVIKTTIKPVVEPIIPPKEEGLKEPTTNQILEPIEEKIPKE